MEASTKLPFACFLLIILISNLCGAEEGSFQIMNDSVEWPVGMSLYGGDQQLGDDEIGVVAAEEEENGSRGRALLWQRMRYYISYGALSANRVPCPPRSGRSYYTHNCYMATGPVHPYSRGCSAITRCRR